MSHRMYLCQAMRESKMQKWEMEKIINGRIDVIRQCTDGAIEQLIELKSNIETVNYLKYLTENKKED